MLYQMNNFVVQLESIFRGQIIVAQMIGFELKTLWENENIFVVSIFFFHFPLEKGQRELLIETEYLFFVFKRGWSPICMRGWH